MTEFAIERARFRHPNGELFKFKIAYPEGTPQHEACRWSFIDESDVRSELWHVQPGDTVYDIGSSFGSYALSALACGAAHVHCFNPHVAEMDLLAKAMMLNGWQERWTPHVVGLYSAAGYLSDQNQEFTPGGTGDFVIGEDGGKYTQRFKVTSLDSLALPEPEGRSVVKIDCEGAEVEILKGAGSFFSRIAPELVLVECHTFKQADIFKRVAAQMLALGYKTVTNRPFHSGEISHALFAIAE